MSKHFRACLHRLFPRSRRGNEAVHFSRHFADVRLLTSAATVGILALAGCTLMPAYHRPPAPISTSWPKVPGYRQTPANATAVPAADIGWRDFFRDERLQQLIELALTNNLDLRAAMLNVDQTRALYRVQRNALVPTVDLNANGTRQRIPFGFGGQGQGFTYSQYNVNLGVAAYELDLFGRVRSLKRQALETYFATEEARKTAQITLVAEVGAAYLTERELTEQLAVARQSQRAARKAYDLTKRSYNAGVLSQLDLNVAESQWQTARAAVAGYEQQLAQADNYLVLLVGCPLPDDLAPPRPFDPQICLSDIPAGLPPDLIARRPDILEAEHQLKAANANIGAARAAFLPTITLTGSGGTESTTLEGLFAPGSQAWNFSPQIVWPIFAAGTAWNELQAIKAARLIEVANYQKAIQTAFREVADSLAARDTVQTQLAANQAQVTAGRQSYELTRARFNHGVDSSLKVLAAQQALDNARQNLILSQYSRLFNLINLYQALGGGWQEHSLQQ
ncbi:MAG TPA: efflux transporter outer membrane subunit [Verrucomicrobiae bacterium]|nr:efflux transporter outer membrane subunit [Verrucomicrobiae bacterium]